MKYSRARVYFSLNFFNFNTYRALEHQNISKMPQCLKVLTTGVLNGPLTIRCVCQRTRAHTQRMHI